MDETISERIIRWESGARFYIAHLHRNLFGQWQVTAAWGARNSRQGNQRHYPAESLAEAVAILEGLAQRRVQHGYRVIHDRVY